MNGSDQNNRRGFLGLAALSIGGLISVMMGIPAIAYILGPALAKEKNQSWVRLGSINKIELGTPTLFNVSIKHNTGWLNEEENIGVYILNISLDWVVDICSGEAENL